MLDEFLEPYGARIKTVKGIGYVIEKLDEKEYSNFCEEVLRHIRRDRYMYFDRNYLAYLILLELIVNEDYISIDALIEKYHYSRGTISKSLLTVKEYLSKFDLSLSLRPKYGIKIVGGEWQIRICMIFSLKIANGMKFLQKKVLGIIERFRQLVEKDLDNYFSVKAIIEGVLQEYGVYIPQVYQAQLAYYIILSQNRADKYTLLEFPDEQITRIKATPYFIAGKALAEAFKRHGYVIERKDEIAMSIILNCYATRQNIGELKPYERIACLEDVRCFIQRVSALYPGVEQNFDDLFEQEFSCYLAGVKERLFFHMPSDEELIYIVKQDGAFVSDLCLDFAKLFFERHGVYLPETELLYAYYILSSTHSRNVHKRARYRVIVTSHYGLHFARNVAERLLHLYERTITEITAFELAEANFIDLTGYDLLITDMAKNQFNHLPIPVVQLDFYRECCSRQLDKHLSRLMEEELRSILKNENFIKDTHFKSKEEVFCYLADHYIAHEDREAFIQDCLRNDAFVCCERRNRLAFISASPQFYNKREAIFLLNKTPFLWRNEQVQMIFFFNRRGWPYRDILIYNAMSSRLLKDSACFIESAYQMNAEDIILHIAKRGLRR